MSCHCTWRDARLTADQLRSLASGGISHEGYVLYILAYNLVPPLVFIGVALVLLLRKPDDGMAYFTALSLVLYGAVTAFVAGLLAVASDLTKRVFLPLMGQQSGPDAIHVGAGRRLPSGRLGVQTGWRPHG